MTDRQMRFHAFTSCLGELKGSFIMNECKLGFLNECSPRGCDDYMGVIAVEQP